MGDNKELPAWVAEALLKEMLNVRPPTASPLQLPPPQLGYVDPQLPAYKPLSPFQPPVAQKDFKAVPYDSYLQEIYCFTTGPNPNAQDLIRDYIHELLSHQNTKLHTGTLQVPRSDIVGNWTMAFAPSIIDSGAWVIVFRAKESNWVWWFWPAKEGSEGQVLDFLTKLREEGKIKSEKAMGVGGTRHKAFHGMVAQATWMNSLMLPMDWRSGEWKRVD